MLKTTFICGGSGSGKTSLAQNFKNAMVISLDSFYYGKDQMVKDENGNFDFDCPQAIDIVACAEAVRKLQKRQSVEIPVYDMVISDRVGTTEISVGDTIENLVVEGLYVLDEVFDDIEGLRIFVDAPIEVKIARRIHRDKEKGRDVYQTLEWSKAVEKKYEQYVATRKSKADLIIPFSYSPIQLLS